MAASPRVRQGGDLRLATTAFSAISPARLALSPPLVPSVPTCTAGLSVNADCL